MRDLFAESGDKSPPFDGKFVDVAAVLSVFPAVVEQEGATVLDIGAAAAVVGQVLITLSPRYFSPCGLCLGHLLTDFLR